MPGFMTRLRATQGTMARALEFTILCAVRTGETIGACWREIDLDAKQPVWAIPAARMKMAEDHRIPLAPQAVALLRAELRPGDVVLVKGSRYRTWDIADALRVPSGAVVTP